MLPFKDAEAIMVSKYPEYDPNMEYDTTEVDDTLEFVKIFRTYKLENGVGKDFGVKYNTDADYSISKNLLKLDDKNVIDAKYNASYDVIYKNFSLTLFYYKDEDIETSVLEKRIEELESSIARREKLLGNENYVNKAPEKIVSEERKKLEEEKEELAKIKK